LGALIGEAVTLCARLADEHARALSRELPVITLGLAVTANPASPLAQEPADATWGSSRSRKSAPCRGRPRSFSALPLCTRSGAMPADAYLGRSFGSSRLSQGGVGRPGSPGRSTFRP
jgi:hypothetical protein